MTQTNCPKFTQNYILADKFAQLRQLKQWRNIIKVFGVKHTQDHSWFYILWLSQHPKIFYHLFVNKIKMMASTDDINVVKSM